jgi:hypothetical protein
MLSANRHVSHDMLSAATGEWSTRLPPQFSAKATLLMRSASLRTFCVRARASLNQSENETKRNLIFPHTNCATKLEAEKETKQLAYVHKFLTMYMQSN